MLQAFIKSVLELFSPHTLRFIIKAWVLAFVLLVVLLFLSFKGLSYLSYFNREWINTILSYSTFFLIVALSFFMFPLVAVQASSLMLDSVAEYTEAKHYKTVKATSIPVGAAVWNAVKFVLIYLGINLLAMPLYIVTAFTAFVLVTGYMCGIEYYDMLAMRYMDKPSAKDNFKKHRWYWACAGLVIAACSLVPVLNIITPVFGILFMQDLIIRKCCITEKS